MDELQNAGDLGSWPRQFEPTSSHTRQGSAFAQVGRFLRHLMEMIFAMIVGMAAWGVLRGALLTPIGFSDVVSTYPELNLGLMAIFMSAPMVLLMRFRKHSWERGGEMVGAMAAPTVVVILCWRLGLGTYIPLFSDQAMSMSAHVAMILGMFLLMFYRRSEYLHAPSHMPAAHAA
jgi:hypothetical protein